MKFVILLIFNMVLLSCSTMMHNQVIKVDSLIIPKKLYRKTIDLFIIESKGLIFSPGYTEQIESVETLEELILSKLSSTDNISINIIKNNHKKIKFKTLENKNKFIQSFKDKSSANYLFVLDFKSSNIPILPCSSMAGYNGTAMGFHIASAGLLPTADTIQSVLEVSLFQNDSKIQRNIKLKNQAERMMWSPYIFKKESRSCFSNEFQYQLHVSTALHAINELLKRI